jgi:hypothetical protein
MACLKFLAPIHARYIMLAKLCSVLINFICHRATAMKVPAYRWHGDHVQLHHYC